MKLKSAYFPTLGILIAVFSLVGTSGAAPTATPATPDEIQQQIGKSTAPLTLVHVWATWCDPCREEFPELVQVINTFPSVKFILISADNPAEKKSVEEFLEKYKSPVGSLISTELSQKFIESLSPNWNGTLPSTFIFKGGKCVSEWEGKRTLEEYTELIEKLNPTNKE
ncbi:TlpA disulfide reductase family protein [Pontiellaceae bacterium B12219]|nr:TlpA disulfide reductase family protein [Pontiellaceae bacterium B12219]